MFQGSIVALVTPMTRSGQIDYKALDEIVDFQLENGTRGIVVAGTTGEAVTLSYEELTGLWRRVVERVSGQVPVIAGSGTNNTASTLERTQMAADAGVDAALIVTPYYNTPTQKGLAAHYEAVAAHCALPLILYNVPSRTAVDMSVATAASLAARPEIVALKEALPEPERIESHVRASGDQMVILSGDDGTALESIRRGARGVISVAANIVPGLMAKMADSAACRKTVGEALEINTKLQPLFRALMMAPNPIPVKWAMHAMGFIEDGIRLPLLPLDQHLRSDFEKTLKTLGLIET